MANRGVRTLGAAPAAPAGATALGAAGPALLVVAVALFLPLSFGVSVPDLLLAVGYELLFVLVPGWLAYQALSPSPGDGFQAFVLGWALGFVLSTLAFIVTAAAGARWTFDLYPVVVIAAAVVVLRRTRSEHGAELPRLLNVSEPAAPWAWAVAGVAALSLAYIALAQFTLTPLPSASVGVLYHPDQLFHLSVAAEALHHWPILDSQVSGEPRAYHVFSHIQIAAMAQVTGIDLPVVYLRLFLVPLVVLLVLELALVGRVLTRNAWVGPVAAGLMLLVGEIDLDPRQQLPINPFDGLFFANVYSNPPFLLGLVLFVPLVLLLYRRLVADRLQSWREWLLVALFTVGCQGAKVSILPVVLGGLIVFSVWHRVSAGRFNRAALVAITGTAVVMTGSYLLQYAGYSSGSSIAPFTSTDQMVGVQLIKEWLDSALGLGGWALDVGGAVFGTVALLCAPLVGIPVLLARRRLRLEARHVWLLSLLLAGLAGFFLIDRNYEFFLSYGYVAGGLLSAEGVVSLFSREHAEGRPLGRLRGMGLGWLALVGLGIVLPLMIWNPVGREASRPLFAGWYAGLVLALAAIYLVARRGGIAGLRAPVLLVTAVVLVGALDTPLDFGVRKLRNEKPTWQYVLPQGMGGGLYQGLRWIRSHTSTDEVLAVNNLVRGSQTPMPRFFYYSAFSERRVFLEGWDFSARAAGNAWNPFPERLRLNDAVFERADPGAMRVLSRRYGVTHLLVDHRHAVSPLLERRTRLVFSNREVAIYAIRPAGGAASSGSLGAG